MLALGTATARPAAAQEPPARADTVAAADTLPPDTLPVSPLPARSPRGAFVRSLVLPGWGQAWVGQPVRGGVYFAMEAGALWMTIKSRRKLQQARAEERWLRESGLLGATEPHGPVRAREDQVEDWMTLAIFLLFFAGADAYVAAHLADVGEHVGVAPAPEGGLRMQVSVPWGRPR